MLLRQEVRRFSEEAGVTIHRCITVKEAFYLFYMSYHFINHRENYTTYEDNSLMSPVALEKLGKSQENYVIGIIVT